MRLYFYNHFYFIGGVFLKSVMSHNFSMIPQAEIQRSSFSRNHGYKTTFSSSYLIPFECQEILPGDSVNLKMTSFCRLATPIVPFMDNLFLDTFFFFVPNRLVWENWQKFMGEKENPCDDNDYLVPTITAPEGGFDVGSVFDYLGIPTSVDSIEVNALPFRACNLIYQEWFKDQNLIDAPALNKGDGPDDPADYPLFKRGKRHDYFTSCLPWPQKGPGVDLPLGGAAPIKIEEGKSPYATFDTDLKLRTWRLPMESGEDYSTGHFLMFADQNSEHTYLPSSFDVMGGQHMSNAFDVSPANHRLPLTSNGINGLYADLSGATAATINSLREAFALQRLLERDARSGSRYTEILRSHFGVVSPDARLQRPEYLGGDSSRIVINPVAQTSATDSATPQGNLAAFGVGGSSFHGFAKSFVEHGYIIGFLNVRADLTYQQGIDRMWSRQTRYDFYWPALSHLGEQAVLNKEIYAQGTSDDDEVFGYQERWAEYRYCQSHITGKFRSTYAQSLDYWHLSQKFDSLPTLSQDFIEENVPISRVVAVPSEPEFLLDAYISLNHVRPMPTYSVPGFIDHF